MPFSVVTYGQYFKKLGIKEGLSNLSVLSIYQDTLGRMWFGTNEGVNVYDGTQIEKIKSYEMTSPDGAVVKKFMNGRVNQIVGDCSGRVYINNNGAGSITRIFLQLHIEQAVILTTGRSARSS